jgi:hypothetical protein
MIMPTWNEILLDLESYMEVYREALEKIASSGEQANPVFLQKIANDAIKGFDIGKDLKGALKTGKIKVDQVDTDWDVHDPGDEDANARESKVTHVDLWDKERKSFDVVGTQEEE